MSIRKNNKIYVVGGYCWSVNRNCQVQHIYEYDGDAYIVPLGEYTPVEVEEFMKDSEPEFLDKLVGIKVPDGATPGYCRVRI